MLPDILWLDMSSYLQAVELDPVIVDIARGYFSFIEDDRLKVIKYIPFANKWNFWII